MQGVIWWVNIRVLFNKEPLSCYSMYILHVNYTISSQCNKIDSGNQGLLKSQSTTYSSTSAAIYSLGTGESTMTPSSLRTRFCYFVYRVRYSPPLFCSLTVGVE